MAGGVPTIRTTRPTSFIGGIGSPDVFRFELTRSITDAFSIGGAIGFGPLGLQASANGFWHALRSPNHGNSLIIGAGLNVAPGIVALAGDGTYFGTDLSVGWEYRAPCGFTWRLSLGPAAYLGFRTRDAVPPHVAPDGTKMPGVPASGTEFIAPFLAPKFAANIGFSW